MALTLTAPSPFAARLVATTLTGCPEPTAPVPPLSVTVGAVTVPLPDNVPVPVAPRVTAVVPVMLAPNEIEVLLPVAPWSVTLPADNGAEYVMVLGLMIVVACAVP